MSRLLPGDLLNRAGDLPGEQVRGATASGVGDEEATKRSSSFRRRAPDGAKPYPNSRAFARKAGSAMSTFPDRRSRADDSPTACFHSIRVARLVSLGETRPSESEPAIGGVWPTASGITATSNCRRLLTFSRLEDVAAIILSHFVRKVVMPVATKAHLSVEATAIQELT